MTLPLISAWYSLDGGVTSLYKWLRVDPPLTVTLDAAGSPHIGIDPAYIQIAPSNTIAIARSDLPGQIAFQLFADTTVVALRVDPPSGPGATASGSGAWAADASFFYFTVPNAAGDGFSWARTALETTWGEPSSER